ncbi:MAG: transglutaminase family protein [Desulfocapsa sp.]|nr:transglutaminase family protein [Desulfocapsa sp.]
MKAAELSPWNITGWQHCWAEFYLPGYDWVPVDPANVQKMMLKEKLELGDAKTKHCREYFRGSWDPYRVKLAMGRDLRLHPPQHGEPLNTFGYPYAQIGTKTLDWLDPESFKYTFDKLVTTSNLGWLNKKCSNEADGEFSPEKRVLFSVLP